MAEKQKYEFAEDAWFEGTFYRAGDTVERFPVQVENVPALKPVKAPAPAKVSPKAKGE